MINAQRRRRRIATPVEQRDVIDTWKDGVIDSKTADRIGKSGLRNSVNQQLKQDGTLSPMPSLVPYGQAATGTILGEICEFTKRSGGTSENYEVSLQNVSGTVSAYYRKDGGAWAVAPGKTFNTTARGHFCPIRDVDSSYNDEDKVLITNGQDHLAWLDINTLTVVPMVALTATTIASATAGAAVTGTNFTHRYRVTAGNRGETAASVAVTVNTTKPRSEWSGATENVSLVINRVSGAEKYHVYYGTEINQESYLFSVDDPTPHSGSGTVTWVDSGVAEPNTFRPAPVGDTTAGPICTRASFINGQVFMTGDIVNPKYVRYGGTGQSILDFSPYGGGGYEPVGANREVPVRVAAFRKPSGDNAVTVICNSQKRYIFTPATIGNTSYFAITEDDGDNLGTTAPDSVISARNQLWYLSAAGVQTTLTKAQIQTILATESVGDNIENFIKRLNTQSLEYACGVVYQNKLHWAVAAGSTTNNCIITLDLSNLRRGAWMLPLNVAADWMWLYTDNSGNTHFCVRIGNTVLEFTDNVATQINGVAFPTSASFGIQKFSKDGKEWADVSRVTFVFNELDGEITCGISGKTEDAPLAILGTETFVTAAPISGWAEREWGALAWGDFETVPDQQTTERQEIVIEIGEELNWWEPSISTSDANVRYELLEIIPEYVNIGVKE
jgi:hypothetical protein